MQIKRPFVCSPPVRRLSLANGRRLPSVFSSLSSGCMRLLAATVFMALISGIPLPGLAQQLTVSENGHYLEYENGKPFFWLGDTAWELFHRLDRQEAVDYLENRAEKGFTVIQAVVLAEFDGLHTPNAYGDTPLIDDDPTRPNEAYFKHVDFIVRKAARLGLHVGMLPTWGDKVVKRWGIGPEIFTPENAYAYGKFLGKRYGKAPVIWILGGDRNPDGPQHIEIWDAMAKGLLEGSGGHQLITYHPQGGGGSSNWFHEKDWLSLNTFQSGHGERDGRNYKKLAHDYRLKPAKPALDAEPNYEDHPVGWKPGELGWFDAFDSRRAGYWSMLSGACGHTYGNHNIWQMLEPGREPVSFARTSWRFAMDQPGAFQAGFMRRLFESLPWQQLVPDQSLIRNKNPEDATHQVAAISSAGDFLLAYTPYGKALRVDLSKLANGELQARWFNPRDGTYWPIASLKGQSSFINEGDVREFKPHSMGRGSDWVLVITASGANTR